MSWYILTVLLCIEAVVTTFAAIRFRRFFLDRLSLKQTDNMNEQPRVALIVPFRGLDSDLALNAKSWFEQSYENYHVFFVLESADDPAVSVLKNFTNSTVFVAGIATDCGQKVHNLKFAIQNISQEYEIFVFADSDGGIGNSWLDSIVRELLKNPNDAVTGYRWFLPTKESIFSHFRTVWNSSVLTLFSESGKSNFAWGGAMGIFRKTFEDAQVLEFWKGSLSDDLGLTRAMRSSKRKIRFVPQAIAVSQDTISAPDLFSWIGRQILITKLYHPALWAGAFAYHMIWLVWMLLGFFRNPFQLLLWFLLFQFFQGLKAEIRLDCMSKLLNRPAGSRVVSWMLSPTISLINVISLFVNIFSRTISWRGIRYRVNGPNELVILSRIGAEKLL